MSWCPKCEVSWVRGGSCWSCHGPGEIAPVWDRTKRNDEQVPGASVRVWESKGCAASGPWVYR